MTMETTCLLDLEDDDESSTCSSFTVATVLSRSKIDASLNMNDPSLNVDSSYQVGRCHEQRSTINSDEELQRLRHTSSLMDDSFESTTDDDIHNNENAMIVSSPPVQESDAHVNLLKTLKKSNVHRSKANKIDSIFRTPAVKENPIEVKCSVVLKPLEEPIVEKSVQTSFMHPVLQAQTPVRTPYDEPVGNSFDESIGNSLLDSTYISFDELDKESRKRRKRQSNKFLSVYDDLSAKAIQRTATFQETLAHKKDKDGQVKRMSAAFTTAMQSVADGISSHAAANARCDVGGSWGVEDEQSLSGNKRNLTSSWGGTHSYAQMQLLAEREEERELYSQRLKNCNAQIKYLQHENLTAFESVALARTESMIAAESRKEVELERDTLKQQVLDTQKECTTMKEAILALAEAEKHRVKTINKLERKLQKAKSSLKKVAALAKDAEDEASTLRETISKLQAENKTLSAELSDKKQYIENECNRHNEKLMTAKKEAKRWQLQVEDNCIEIKMLQMKLATAKKSGKPQYEELDITRATPNPNGSAMALINAFGAEDVTIGSELFNKQTFAEKQPMQTALLSPPGPSSRQLSYVDDKENQPNASSTLLIQKVRSAKQQKCCLCFKDTTGVMRSCQCGQKKCDKRAHATCLSKYKVGNIPSCVSHPGTPLPHMPLILCKGIWK